MDAYCGVARRDRTMNDRSSRNRCLVFVTRSDSGSARPPCIRRCRKMNSQRLSVIVILDSQEFQRHPCSPQDRCRHPFRKRILQWRIICIQHKVRERTRRHILIWSQNLPKTKPIPKHWSIHYCGLRYHSSISFSQSHSCNSWATGSSSS